MRLTLGPSLKEKELKIQELTRDYLELKGRYEATQGCLLGQEEVSRKYADQVIGLKERLEKSEREVEELTERLKGAED